ncbi:MAG: chorismate synthase [Cyanobacteria bacterium HKST-UBA02]|nr:chorismate synthase [Cyanobacteria bacterium HKST-UBA02]
MRFLTCGESHGPMLVSLLDGMPAGLPVCLDRVNRELRRRQKGYGRGARQKIETDTANFVGGIRHGITTGAPVGIVIENRDWQNWQTVMSAEPIDSDDDAVAELLLKKQIKHFRPGHADLPGTLKYGHLDIRNVLERASARETAARVAAGAVCLELLERFGITVVSHVVQVGDVAARPPAAASIEELCEQIEESELSCADPEAVEKMKGLIKEKWQEGDSLGGIIEVMAEGLPVGLGSYTQWDRRLDGRLGQAIMSIQAMKAVEIGDGFKAATLPGSQVHDAIYPSFSDEGLPFTRHTNRAGGIEGGMTNGERLLLRAYMKPIPTLRAGLPSVSYPEFDAHQADYERSDVCAISAASVVCRAMIALVLADCFLEKFGGDSIADVEAALDNYRTQWQIELAAEECS